MQLAALAFGEARVTRRRLPCIALQVGTADQMAGARQSEATQLLQARRPQRVSLQGRCALVLSERAQRMEARRPRRARERDDDGDAKFAELNTPTYGDACFAPSA